MCFRPSAVDGTKNNNIQMGICESCGQPVAASIGITSGTCPHCGNVIPAKPSPSQSSHSQHNVKIL